MNKTHGNVSASQYRIFLIDDHPIVRQGLALFINRESDLIVCGEADGVTGVTDESLQSDWRSIDTWGGQICCERRGWTENPFPTISPGKDVWFPNCLQGFCLAEIPNRRFASDFPW